MTKYKHVKTKYPELINKLTASSHASSKALNDVLAKMAVLLQPMYQLDGALGALWRVEEALESDSKKMTAKQVQHVRNQLIDHCMKLLGGQYNQHAELINVLKDAVVPCETTFKAVGELWVALGAEWTVTKK